MHNDETIAAISTATGGAIAVVRISGKKAFEICNSVWKRESTQNSPDPATGRMHLGHCVFSEGVPSEKAYAVFFKAPKSYTGEDMAEIQCHGGAKITRRVLEALYAGGAKAAAPGEFTYRAFMNGKLDLTQAEAVADIITAKTDLSLNLAERQVDGAIGTKIRKVRECLVGLLAECESRLDFSDENLEWTNPSEMNSSIESSVREIRRLIRTAKQGMIIRDGVKVVIAGHPNAGKSTIFNLLLGCERAIVTDIPGTTRDTVEECAVIDNAPVRLIDTAGIHEAEDIIESMGIARSRKSIKTADIILWILDPTGDIKVQTDEMLAHSGTGRNLIAAWNKCDMLDAKIISALPELGIKAVTISAKNNPELNSLRELISQSIWGTENVDSEPEFAVNSRHAEKLERSIENLIPAKNEINNENWELVSVGLREAISNLGEITGETVSPDILGEIFARFCIGK